MHSQNYRLTITITLSALIAVMFISPGCRGNKPFGRFVKVTQEPESNLPYVDPPQQRLATSQLRGASGVTDGGVEITMEAKANGQVSAQKQVAQANRRDLAVDRKSLASNRTSSGSNRRTLQQDFVRRDNLSRDVNETTGVAAKVASQKNTAQNSTKQRSVPSPQVESLASNKTNTQQATKSQRNSSLTQNSNRKQVAVDPFDNAAIGNSTQHSNTQHSNPQHSELLDAFADYPPEVQREALRRLVAATSKSAAKTDQPSGFESELQKQAKHLPELPPAKNSAADVPAVRLGTPQQSKPQSASSVGDLANQSIPQETSGRELLAQQQKAAQEKIAAMTNRVSNLATGVLEPKQLDESALQTGDLNIAASAIPPATASVKDVVADANQGSVQPASASLPKGEADHLVAQAVPDTKIASLKGTTANSIAVSAAADSMSDDDLYNALVKQLSTAPQGESESQRSSRLIKLRHLMVLSGDVDSAVKKIEGMSESEQEFLRHQLLGLWTMVDPSGHPVASRRITTALPQLRQATQFAAAATDSLEVRSVSFCSEIESYGQIKPFKSNRFDAGQQVILYCEIENFSAKKSDEGYVTEMQGSYDIFDENNQKVVSQLLPADRQASSNYLRDYYIAYQMHLPKQLPAGKYRLQLTMEDVGGKKYGQSSIDLEIK